jgi:hypothetical protein
MEALPAATPADRLLDLFCFCHNYTWNAEEPLLLFRAEGWSVLREREIPERMAVRWQRIAAERGNFSFDDLAEMATLNGVQRRKLIQYAGKQPWYSANIFRQRPARPFLLFYGRLRPDQREKALGEGLPSPDLDVGQRQLLLPILKQIRSEAQGLGQEFVRLKMREAPPKGKGTKETEGNAFVVFHFRDREQRSIRFGCLAEPQKDPWTKRP